MILRSGTRALMVDMLEAIRNPHHTPPITADDLNALDARSTLSVWLGITH